MHQYANAGTYLVTLQVKTDKGCANALSLSKNIIVSPLPTAGFVSPEVCLSDASAIFIDTSAKVAGSITKWAWNFGDANATPANNISNLKNPSHRYSAIGNYTATMVITSNAKLNFIYNHCQSRNRINTYCATLQFRPYRGYVSSKDIAIQNF